MMHKKYREAILRRPNAPKDRFSEIEELQKEITSDLSELKKMLGE